MLTSHAFCEAGHTILTSHVFLCGGSHNDLDYFEPILIIFLSSSERVGQH